MAETSKTRIEAGDVTNSVIAGRIDGDVTVNRPMRKWIVPQQLPATSRHFTGRQAELEQLTVALDDCPTVVISALGGVGGIGKTWLALQWAHQHLDQFPDGQLFVDLHGFDQHEEPMPAHEAVRSFLDALGVSVDDMPQDMTAQVGLYRSLVANRRMLIVLDNARDSDQVEPLVRSLQSLTRVSLLQGFLATRYRMHDLVRLYAADLAGPAESAAALARLAAASCHTSHAADQLLAAHHEKIDVGDLPAGCTLPKFVDQDQAWKWMSDEWANVMALQRVALDRGWHSTAWVLAWTMTTFNLRRGYFHDDLELRQRSLQDNLEAWVSGVEAAKHLDEGRRTRAYRHLSRACSDLNRYEDAYRYGLDGLAWAKECRDELGEAHTCRAVARACERRGDNEEALMHTTRALALYEKLDKAFSGSHALDEIGWYTAKLGRFEEAHQHSAKALEQCRDREDSSGEATALMTLGFIANGTGDPVEAIRLYEQSQAISRELGDEKSEGKVLDYLGDAAAAIDPIKASQAWDHSAKLYKAQRLPEEAARVREKLAGLPQP